MAASTACSAQTPTAAEINAGAQAGLETAPLTIRSANGNHRFEGVFLIQKATCCGGS